MTPAEVKTARHALGLSAEGFARALKMKGVHADRTVRRWEDPRTDPDDIPGYVTVLLDIWLDPRCPVRFMPHG